ncbi:MAG: hypothetical protein ACC661_06390, partial [Verrucomicrobiales bacterium]
MLRSSKVVASDWTNERGGTTLPRMNAEGEEGRRPVVTSYCSHFLPADMRHVYRQVAGLRSFESRVITAKRDHTESFPFPEERIARHPK